MSKRKIFKINKLNVKEIIIMSKNGILCDIIEVLSPIVTGARFEVEYGVKKMKKKCKEMGKKKGPEKEAAQKNTDDKDAEKKSA